MSNIREKEGDTACYRGEALWLDTEGEVFIPYLLPPKLQRRGLVF